MQCGHGAGSTDAQELPAKVKFFGRMSVKHISAGQYHSLALTEDGELYSWGLGRYGRLGQGHTDPRGEPQKVVFSMPGLDQSAISSNSERSELEMIKNLEGTTTPNRASILKSDPIVQITAGDAHSLVLTSQGRLFTFGYNHMGQCGHGSTKNVLVAHPVEKVKEESDRDGEQDAPRWICVAGGREHSLAVSDAKHVYACGNNRVGQLGLAGLAQCFHFSKVHSLEQGRFAQVFAGGDHSFALLDMDKPKIDGAATSEMDIEFSPPIMANSADPSKQLIQHDEQLLDDDDMAAILENEAPALLQDDGAYTDEERKEVHPIDNLLGLPTPELRPRGDTFGAPTVGDAGHDQ